MIVAARLAIMGGDGGCFITRADCVKTKGYGFTKSGSRYTNSLGELANYIQMVSEDSGLGPVERHRLRMSTCFISQQDLQEPVVACRLGNLYNKEAVIGALLSKSMPSGLSHIRALKDVKHCSVTWAEGSGGRRLVCPVSREELDTGGSRAVMIWTTGAVISAKTLKELKLTECPVTAKVFDPATDVVPLVPNPEELEKLQAALPAAPAKKRKASEPTVAAASSSGEPPAPAAKEEQPAKEAEADRRKAKAAKTGGADSEVFGKKGEVFDSLFTKDRKGMAGTRDAFGTPCYFRGAHL